MPNTAPHRSYVRVHVASGCQGVGERGCQNLSHMEIRAAINKYNDEATDQGSWGGGPSHAFFFHILFCKKI